MQIGIAFNVSLKSTFILIYRKKPTGGNDVSFEVAIKMSPADSNYLKITGQSVGKIS